MKTFINYYNKIIFLLLFLFKLVSDSDTTSIRCLKANEFNGIDKGEKIIGDKNKCFKISNNCCFINITFNYGEIPLKHEYCYHLTSDYKIFEQFLFDLYNDDEMYYANFTAHNLDMYKTIGRNLETNLTETLNCFIGPKNYEEYSTYVVNNCKEFVDGVCTGKKNNTQFNEFMSGFHKNYSKAYCNKKEEGKKCIKYNGTRANDKMVKPLLDELVSYLQADNEFYNSNYNNTNVIIDIEDDEEDGSSTFQECWMKNDHCIKNCTQRPNVSVQVECPEGFNFHEFLKFNKILFFIFLLIAI